MLPEKKIWFRNVCIKNGLNPTEAQVDQLECYANLLLDWNKRINLISRKDEENLWTYHILHCVSLLFKVDIAQGLQIVDIGTGGGLPGLPLKILRPDLSIVCLDSTGKKAAAVKEMIHDLQLNGIEAVWGRAEEIGSKREYSKKFDLAVARAVGPLKDLLAWSHGFLRTSVNERARGAWEKRAVNIPALITFKGGDLAEEINMAKRSFSNLDIVSIDLSLTGTENLIASDKKILIVHFSTVNTKGAGRRG